MNNKTANMTWPDYFKTSVEPTPQPTPIKLEDGMNNFDVIEAALNRIYDLAECSGDDTISLMIQVAADHLDIIKRKIALMHVDSALQAVKQELSEREHGPN